MKLKRVLGFLGAAFVGMSAGLSGCGNSEGAANAEISDVEAVSEGSVQNGEAAEGEDIAEIEVMFWTGNAIPTDKELVENAINEITESEINTKIHLNIIEMGNYIQQVNLMLSGGEKLDLMVTLPGGSAHFNSLTSQKQLMDISELLEEYAPELMALVPETWMEATRVDGKLYAVTSYSEKVSAMNFICRTDLLEETGIDPKTITDANGLEALFAKVKELHPEITPVAPGTKKVLGGPYLINAEGKFVRYDALGDGDNALIGIMEGDGSKIQNNYLRQEYVDTSLRLQEWYGNDWIYKDGANYSESAQSLIDSEIAFGCFVQLGMDAQASQNAVCGHEMTLIPLEEKPLLETSGFRKFTWAVPTTATEPEAAVKFMNLAFTDERIVNLLNWGIEDVHYRTLEDGTIDFLEGQDASSCGYYLSDETAFLGNGFLAKVRKGQAPDLRERSEKANLEAEVSKFNGFSFNSDGFENQIAGLTNAVEEYRPSFACGLYTPEYYDEFIQKLDSNGASEYIAYIQEQLDAWLSAKDAE